MLTNPQSRERENTHGLEGLTDEQVSWVLGHRRPISKALLDMMPDYIPQPAQERLASNARWVVEVFEREYEADPPYPYSMSAEQKRYNAVYRLVTVGLADDDPWDASLYVAAMREFDHKRQWTSASCDAAYAKAKEVLSELQASTTE